ncbi:MAG: glycosyltransferase [Desulfuromonas sp.]|nr:MAG: glycosyltransferase [Desulfuromonas sp.]
MKLPVNVLHLASPTGVYGAERWILALIKNIDTASVVSMVASVRDDEDLSAPICAEAKVAGFRTRVFDAFGRFNLNAVRQLKEFIVENRIDILHAHGYKTDLLGLLAVRGTGCRLVTTPHGWTKQPDLKLRLYELLDRVLFGLFDAVVPLSHELLDALQKNRLARRKLHYIANGVDIDEIDAVQKGAAELVSWRDNGNFIIGYIGRLSTGKGLDTLLRAVADCRYPKLRVAIVGEGELRQQLEQLSRQLGIADRVSFFGFRPDRLEFLKMFDLFVLPSLSEGTPRCVMEAMAAGVTVLASDIPGCRVLIEDGRTGLLFPPGEMQHLTAQLQRLIADESLRVNLSAAAGDFVRERFSARAMAIDYEQLYLRLVH